MTLDLRHQLIGRSTRNFPSTVGVPYVGATEGALATRSIGRLAASRHVVSATTHVSSDAFFLRRSQAAFPDVATLVRSSSVTFCPSRWRGRIDAFMAGDCRWVCARNSRRVFHALSLLVHSFCRESRAGCGEFESCCANFRASRICSVFLHPTDDIAARTAHDRESPDDRSARRSPTFQESGMPTIFRQALEMPALRPATNRD